jgi:hypothetical protein
MKKALTVMAAIALATLSWAGGYCTGKSGGPPATRRRADMLERVKDHVNNLGRLFEKMEAVRDSASPWQQ